jgi:hypothetical protein
MFDSLTLDNQRVLINLQGKKASFKCVKKPSEYTNMKTRIYHELLYELRIRNFNIPNVELSFSYNNETKEIDLYHMSGEDYNISLSYRTQSLSTIIIPHYNYSVYDDMSGQLVVYAGKNWKEDKKRFLNNRGIHTKMQGRDKWYLLYDLRASKPDKICEISEKQHKLFIRAKKIQELFDFDESFIYTLENYYYNTYYFLNNDDCGREYLANYNECKYYHLIDMDYHVYGWVYKNVIQYLKSLPIPELLPFHNIFKEPTLQKITYKIPDLYLSGRNSTKYEEYFNRVCYEKKLKVSPSYRLLSLSESVKNIKNPLKQLAYEGFVWCVEEYDVPRSKFNENEVRPFFKISLKIANEVYVIDVSDNKTKEEVVESFIPINEYNGEYKKEMFLICRDIRADEIVLHEKLKNKLYGKK